MRGQVAVSGDSLGNPMQIELEYHKSTTLGIALDHLHVTGRPGYAILDRVAAGENRRHALNVRLPFSSKSRVDHDTLCSRWKKKPHTRRQLFRVCSYANTSSSPSLHLCTSRPSSVKGRTFCDILQIVRQSSISSLSRQLLSQI